jgi:hypothetical protein
LALAVSVGFAAPASAIPLTWSGPFSLHVNPLDFTVGTGTLKPGLPKTHLNLNGSSLGSKSIAYAGPLSVTLNTIPPTFPTNLIVFCDDLAHNITPNHTYNNYFVSDPAAPADVFHFLNVGSPKQEEILGLVARGTEDFLTSSLTAELGAAFQMAIWELEYGGSATFSGDAGFQSLVDSLIANSAADYAFFTSTKNFLVPWTFSQLEAPCSAKDVGVVTKDSKCETQGLILAIPGTPLTSIPEPITLSLFGAGLAGVASLRRRRRNTQ